MTATLGTRAMIRSGIMVVIAEAVMVRAVPEYPMASTPSMPTPVKAGSRPIAPSQPRPSSASASARPSCRERMMVRISGTMAIALAMRCASSRVIAPVAAWAPASSEK